MTKEDKLLENGMSKPKNFTTNPDEVGRRLLHAIKHHGLGVHECELCGSENPACPRCGGELFTTISNPGKCSQPDCPLNPIVPVAARGN